MNRKTELIIKFSLFACLTAVTLTVTLTFPNVPILKDYLKGGRRVDVSDREMTDREREIFERDPERTIPGEPNIVVAPADGYVMGLKEMNGYHHIIIEMRYYDVHVQRFPMAGRVVEILGGGKELDDSAGLSEYWKDKMLPFQKMTTMDTEIGPVRVRQITSLFANRVEVWVEPGVEVERGQRLGRVIAGSTVVLEIPDSAEIEVSLDDEVTAGETIVARY